MFNAFLLALLLLATTSAVAQEYRPAVLHPAEYDVQTIESLASTRRAKTKKNLRAHTRPEVWTLFGRVGPMNFSNQLDASSDGMQFTVRRNSHGLSGNIYVGFHRQF